MWRGIFVISLGVISNGWGDIITDLSRSGRPTGATYIYYIDTNERLVRALCPYTTNEVVPSRLNCGVDRKSIDAAPFIDYFSPGLEDRLGLLLKTYEALQLKGTFLRGLEGELSTRPLPPDDNRESIESLRSAMRSQQTDLEEITGIIHGISESSRGLLTMLGELRKPFSTFAYVGQGRESGPARIYVRQFEHAFREAELRRGSRCRQESARFTNAEGGCRDSQTNLIWGEFESGIDAFDYQFWTREGAIRHCAHSKRGTKVDWRLPTLEELRSVSGAPSGFVSWDPFAFYWSITQEEKNLIVSGERELGTHRESAGSHRVNVGEAWDITGAYRFPVYRDFQRMREVSTSLNARFEFLRTSDFLLQPATGRTFEVMAHRLLSADANLTRNFRDFQNYPSDVRVNPYSGMPQVYATYAQEMASGQEVRSTSALAYANFYEFPTDVRREKIGLICVRQSE